MALKGPYHGPPTASGRGSGQDEGDVVTIFSALWATATSARPPASCAACCIPGEANWRQKAVSAPDDALAINATDGGDVCLYDASRAMLVHDPAHAGTMSIEAMNGGTKAAVDWPAGTQRLPWPRAMPIADGDMFMFQQSGDNAVAVADRSCPAGNRRGQRGRARGAVGQGRLPRTGQTAGGPHRQIGEISGPPASVGVAHVEHIVAVEEPARLLAVAVGDLGGERRDLRLGVFAELVDADLAVVVAGNLRVGGAGRGPSAALR